MTVADLEAAPPAVYDFRTPRALTREAARVLDAAFESFARHFASALTGYLGASCTVRSGGVSVLRYDDYVAGLPVGTAMFLAATPISDASAIVQLPVGLGLDWISRMLGGRFDQEAASRALTSLEFTMLRRILDEALQDVAYCLGDLLEAHLRIDDVHYGPQQAQAAAAGERMLVARFEIGAAGSAAVPVTLAIPADLVLPRLSSDGGAAQQTDPRAALLAGLADVPVDVVLRLAPRSVRPAEVLNLAVGDLMPLPHAQHRPLAVVVDGEQVAEAAVGAAGARLACLVVSVKEEKQ